MFLVINGKGLSTAQVANLRQHWGLSTAQVANLRQHWN
jgi:hypothetical protein